jgi:hypothetical protein
VARAGLLHKMEVLPDRALLPLTGTASVVVLRDSGCDLVDSGEVR